MDTPVIPSGDFKVMFILKGYYLQYPLGYWVKSTVRKKGATVTPLGELIISTTPLDPGSLQFLAKNFIK